jgi:nucleoside-diphosphate-sugar epimerase
LARVLVTGASGFIGTPLTRALSKSHEVIGPSRGSGDIADPNTLLHLAPVDHVFHLAGRTFVPDSWKDPIAFLSSNVVGTSNVLGFCRRVSAQLTFVSAYVYGKPDKLPVSENAEVRPNNPYALSKYLAEQLCEFGAQHDGVDVTVVRPFNVYGPGQAEHFLIPTIVSQVRAGGSIRVMDLAPKRDYLHVDDLVDLLIATLTRREPGYRVMNAGSGESHSVGEVIAIVQSVAGTSLSVVDQGQARYEELDDVRADITRAWETLGWAPKIPLKDGIERLIRGPGNTE